MTDTENEAARNALAAFEAWAESVIPTLDGEAADFGRDRIAQSQQARTVRGASEQAAPPLDVELAAIYLAAAMRECGYTATEADARSILDYIRADNNAAIARLGSADEVKHAAWCNLPDDHKGLCDGDQ